MQSFEGVFPFHEGPSTTLPTRTHFTNQCAPKRQIKKTNYHVASLCSALRICLTAVFAEVTPPALISLCKAARVILQRGKHPGHTKCLTEANGTDILLPWRESHHLRGRKLFTELCPAWSRIKGSRYIFSLTTSDRCPSGGLVQIWVKWSKVEHSRLQSFKFLYDFSSFDLLEIIAHNKWMAWDDLWEGITLSNVNVYAAQTSLGLRTLLFYIPLLVRSHHFCSLGLDSQPILNQSHDLTQLSCRE